MEPKQALCGTVYHLDLRKAWIAAHPTTTLTHKKKVSTCSSGIVVSFASWSGKIFFFFVSCICV